MFPTYAPTSVVEYGVCVGTYDPWLRKYGREKRPTDRRDPSVSPRDSLRTRRGDGQHVAIRISATSNENCLYLEASTVDPKRLCPSQPAHEIQAFASRSATHPGVPRHGRTHWARPPTRPDGTTNFSIIVIRGQVGNLPPVINYYELQLVANVQPTRRREAAAIANPAIAKSATLAGSGIV